ncbi:MAG TPA: hypothetical protein VM841_12670 [Actinomycetota bacterium]|nr:hypothetical protein [Actinomycetota bacterium]
MIADAVRARTLIDKASTGLTAAASLEDVLAEAGEALVYATASGDSRLVLDALLLRAQALTAIGDATAEDWLAVERAARDLEDWLRVAFALRMQVMGLLDDHAPDAAAPAARLGDVAAAQAMPRDIAWAEAVRAEIAMVAGRWDVAHTTAMRAVTNANRAEDPTTMLRAWHVVIPIAAARRDEVRLSLAFYAYERRRLTASPYARLLDAAATAQFAAFGLTSAPPLRFEDLPGAFDGAAAMPHWLAAVETIVGGWIEAGEFAAAERALEKMGGGRPTGLGAGVEALLRARLHAAEGSPPQGVAAQAWHALEVFSRIGAPWWIAKAIGALGRNATPTLKKQAKQIELVLRVR